MSSTRHAKTSEGSEASPWRDLANGKLRGINIGLNTIVRVGVIRTATERSCMIWLHNYARLQNLTADALSGALDLSKPDIRAALTDPDASGADLKRFVRQTEDLRGKFESNLRPLADIEPTRIVRDAMRMALEEKKIVDVIGLTRIGKTEPATDWFKRNAMDRGVMFNCPHDESDRNFTWEWARALGITANTNKKTSQIWPQIRGCLGTNMIEFVAVDEGHFLWPANKKSKPKRIEALRSAYDMRTPAQIGVVNLTTPQHTISMNLALADNEQWAPGQWKGRAIPFHLSDIVSDADLASVAKWHASDFSDGMIAALVVFGKASHGYCGAMVNVIARARFEARLRSGASRTGAVKVSRDQLLDAMGKMVKGTPVEALVKQAIEGGASPARTKVVKLRSAA